MRETTIDIKIVLEYCKAILNAETEEEVLEIKAELVEVYRKNGLTEEDIQRYLNNVDEVVAMVESGEITISENGALVRKEVPTQEVTEVTSADVNTSSQANTLAGIGLGTVGATLVACIAIKKRFFKNKKNKNL